MQVLRTTTATPIVEPTYGSARLAGATVATPAPATSEARQPTPTPTGEAEVDPARRRSTPAADLPALTGSDRAAIASATGFYISPTGEVTPDGMPPWSFIMQYLERRHVQGTPEAPAQPAAATAARAAAEDVRRLDRQV